MKVPVVVDELNAAETFDEFLEAVKHEGIKVKEWAVAGTPVALLTRPDDNNPSSAMQDECEMTVVNGDYELVCKGIDKIYPLDHTYSNLMIVNNRPTYVEEKLTGVPIILCRQGCTYLTVTKDSIHGSTILPGFKSETAGGFLVSELNRIMPNKGLDGLFDPAWTTPMSWQFIITQDKFGDNRLVLLSGMNLDTGDELNLQQIDNIAEHFHLDRPARATIYNRHQIQDAVRDLLKKSPKLKKVVLRNGSDLRATYKITAEDRLGTTPRGCRKELLVIAECIMRDIQLLDVDANDLVNILKSNMERLVDEASLLYELHKHRRTRKRYAENIDHHPLAKVLYALRDNKIEAVKEWHKVLAPAEFVKLIGRVDGERLHDAVEKYKEAVCQQPRLNGLPE